jgi:hypothetical protein
MTVRKPLHRIPQIQSLDDFIGYVGSELANSMTFHSCLALESRAGTEAIFLTPPADVTADLLINVVVALTTATRAHRVFVAYHADLTGMLGTKYGQLGKHQAIFFESNSERSHPFVFCKLDAETPEWKIIELCRMIEPDKYNGILFSDLHHVIGSSKAENNVLHARAFLEKWPGDLEWDWESHDEQIRH